MEIVFDVLYVLLSIATICIVWKNHT